MEHCHFCMKILDIKPTYKDTINNARLYVHETIACNECIEKMNISVEQGIRSLKEKMNLNKQQNEMYHMVREFHEAFGHKMADKPTPIDSNTAVNRAVWTGEELVEFLYATAGGREEVFLNLFEQFTSGVNKAASKILTQKKPVEDVLVAQMDALIDVEYFNQGSFTIAGVEPFNLFKIVQEANMGKLFPDGKPRYREEDGKIIKPDNWESDFAPEPRLTEEIERQINEDRMPTDNFKKKLNSINNKLEIIQRKKEQCLNSNDFDGHQNCILKEIDLTLKLLDLNNSY